MDIRAATRVIVRRGPDYLVGTILYSRDLRWSSSQWDAWMTRRKDVAGRVARKVGGELVLFNPVSGQLREVRNEAGIQG